MASTRSGRSTSYRRATASLRQTEYGARYNYRVTRHLIIDPSEGWVLDPTQRPTLVLTTCNPRFSASQRLVVFAERVNG